MNKKTQLLFYMLAILLLHCGFGIPNAWAEGVLSINLIAVNASPDEAKEVEVKHYLPRELAPEDIIDSGSLKIDYDVDKGLYYAYVKILFEAQQSKTFKIRVKDVWVIEMEEIDILKTQLKSNLESLQDHENFMYAQRMSDRLLAELNFILGQQKNYSEDIDRRIEEYRAYRERLEEIRSNIYNLDFLKFQAKALDTMASMNKTIKFVVEVRNPSDQKEKTIMHKHYLPQEVRSEDIVEKHDFDVRFDEKKGRAFLSKEETFQPNQVKKYEFVIKDIWQFPAMKLNDLSDRTLIALSELGPTIFAKSANYLSDKIHKTIETIRASIATPTPSIREHIGLFRTNERRYEQAWSDFKKIEEMIAIVRAKKLKELEDTKVKNVLQKLKALRGLSALANALFKKTISVTVTWRIIMGAIAFVSFFTALHFFIWAKRSKTLGEELGLPEGESIKVVPKPGQEEEKEEE